MDKFVTLGSFKNVQGKILADIRRMLNNENGLSPKLYVVTSIPFPNFRSAYETLKLCSQGSPFCNKAGAVANEGLPFTEYIKSLDRGVSKSKEDAKKDSGDQGYSTIVVSHVAFSHMNDIDDCDSPGKMCQ